MQAAAEKIYDIDAIRQMEQKIVAQGTSVYDLMCWAGESAWNIFQTSWSTAQKIIVLCGGGNNAGDGYVFARCAQAAAKNVQVVYLKDPQLLPEPAKQAAQYAIAQGVDCKPYSATINFSGDMIIDALLGIGFAGELAENYFAIINAANQSNLPIFSIDVPSGLNAATGVVSKLAIKANQTVTMLGLKTGLVTNDAFDYVGKLNVATWPKPLVVDDCGELIPKNILARCLPPRKQNCNKGDFGHVLAIGGGPGFSGAIRMAAESALRVGAGLVTIATHPSHATFLNLTCPELMCQGVEDEKDLVALINSASVILLGSGLGQTEWAKALWQVAIRTNKPMVIDADGLNLLSQNFVPGKNWILTPHPGEAARLLHCGIPDVQQDRWSAAKKLQQQYQSIAVLKGAGTLIADEEKIYVDASSNPGMATAGMGDVLAGMIAGFLAQGLSRIDAAKVGVKVHSLAAQLIANEHGPRGMLACDLWLALPELINPRYK